MHCFKVLFGRFEKNSIIPTAAKNFSAYLNRHCKVKNFSVMACREDIDPPKDLKGIKVLDKNLFKKVVDVSCITVLSNKIYQTLKILKPFLLKQRGIKPCIDFENNYKKFLLKPNIANWDSFDSKTKALLGNLDISEKDFHKQTIELSYDNYSAHNILKTILPEEPVLSYSQIGHIIHLNLNEDLNEYKNLIAQIYFDKVHNTKTVVCKKEQINHSFRFFEMEVLCGENNLMASVKENKCNYELDFSKVYWNPRLSTEHRKIVEMIKERDVLFDVFAGIGPFSIPAAKKKCVVFANDLNPESVKWLNHNILLNKKCKEYITVFNKDGGDFILNDAKQNLIKTWENEYFNGSIFFVMNLPAIALTFLKHFKDLISMSEVDHISSQTIKKFLPIVHCYFFAYKMENTLEVIERDSGIMFKNIEHNISFVRLVSPKKCMYRLTFSIPFEYLLSENKETNLENYEPLAKKICHDLNNIDFI